MSLKRLNDDISTRYSAVNVTTAAVNIGLWNDNIITSLASWRHVGVSCHYLAHTYVPGAVRLISARQQHLARPKSITPVSSVVNKDLSFKAKAKAKDLTSEHVQGPL